MHVYMYCKNTCVIVLFLMFPQFGIIYLMMFILPTLLPVSEKKLKSYLFNKGFPTPDHKLPGVSMVLLSLSLQNNDY